MRTITLAISVEFDENVTDAVLIMSAMNTLMETALSTPGILDECGNPSIGSFYVKAKEFVHCSLCGDLVPISEAHLHQDKWIGECCWDDRLKASE